MRPGLTPERWRIVEPLLERTLDLPPAERRAWLDSAAGADQELREDLERLVDACESAGGFLARPALEAYGSLLQSLAQSPRPHPARIGPYRVVGVAGEGGMGTVYAAERDDDQYLKRVAIKLARGGWTVDPRRVSRFIEERQILARLDHPNIARLLDGGVTDDGLPWFAMEFVEGLRIDRYSEQHRLPIPERLRLFLEVCSAVEYAHRNLVVHRDLKPSNILVGHDGSVRLLDFGIAKLVSAATSTEPDLTRTGARFLTPSYASPEQLRGAQLSTATDVYSLGVVLYELLAGVHPFAGEESEPREVERAVLDDDAEPPSVAMRWSHPDMPGRLRRQVAGDLDNIVLMAIRKEPARRYPSVEQLAADIRRHLDGVPVTAHKDSIRYRAGKFLRRHPYGTVAAAGFLLLAGGFAVVTSVQADRTARERENAEQLANLLSSMFAEVDPSPSGRGSPVTAHEMLDSAASRLRRFVVQAPSVRAELYSVLGRSYAGLGAFGPAKRLLDSAVSIRSRLTTPDSALARDQASLGRAYLTSSGDAIAAESLGRASLATARRAGVATAASRGIPLTLLGDVWSQRGRFAEAESVYREAASVYRSLQGRDRLALADLLLSLGHLRWLRGDPTQADSMFREALILRRQILGPEHPAVGMAQIELAKVLHDRGDPAAESMLRSALAVTSAAMGATHPTSTNAMAHLGGMLADRADWVAAESVYRAAIEPLRQSAPAGGQTLAMALTGLGRVLLARNQSAEAEQLLREAIDIYRPALPAWQYAETLEYLGAVLTQRKRFPEAERALLESLEARSTTWGPSHQRTLRSVRRLSVLYRAWGKPTEAARFDQRLVRGSAPPVR